jgi:hypothetical protein
MWLSADPAMGEYIPQAPINDAAKQHNKELPGMGGVFNYVNLHAYHYAGNNPVKLTDPDGRIDLKKVIEGMIYMTGSAGLMVGTLVEDVGTGGIGIVDDPISFAIAGDLFVNGYNLMREGILLSPTSPVEGPTINEVRRRNWLPEKGVPGSVVWNPPRTQGRKYGADGYPELDWNEPNPDASSGSLEAGQHVHRWKQRSPNSPVPGKGDRGKPEIPTEGDRKIFGK